MHTLVSPRSPKEDGLNLVVVDSIDQNCIQDTTISKWLILSTTTKLSSSSHPPPPSPPPPPPEDVMDKYIKFKKEDGN